MASTPTPPSAEGKAITVTEAQRCMLECIDEHAGYEWDGWAEVELQWSSKRGVPDALVSRAAWNCAEALRRKGLLKDDFSPVLTDAGVAFLEPRR